MRGASHRQPAALPREALATKQAEYTSGVALRGAAERITTTMPDHEYVCPAIDPAAGALMGTANCAPTSSSRACSSPASVASSYTHYDRMIVGGAMPSEGRWRWRRSSRPAPRRSSTAAN
jgi:hypothetical protein